MTLETACCNLQLGVTLQELTDLRHSHARVKKLLQEKTLEWEHAKSRSDQYEADVKKLRVRVDELKQSLAASEDEVRNMCETPFSKLHAVVFTSIFRSTSKPIRSGDCSARTTSCRFSARTCKFKWSTCKRGESTRSQAPSCCCFLFTFHTFSLLVFRTSASKTSQFEQLAPHVGPRRRRPQEVQAQRPPARLRRRRREVTSAIRALPTPCVYSPVQLISC